MNYTNSPNRSHWHNVHSFFDDLAEYPTPRSAIHHPSEFFSSINQQHYNNNSIHIIKKGGISGYNFI